MRKRLITMVGLMALIAMFSGCRGCIRENAVWQHTFKTPAQRACPELRREYEVPPRGPYYEKPSAKGAFATKPAKSEAEITVTK